MRYLIFISAVASLLAACGQRSDSGIWSDTTPAVSYTPVPKPTAYPRLPIYDTAMVVVEQAPVHWLANAQAQVALPERSGSDDGSTRWLNIDYPDYGIILYCTFTNVDPLKREEVIVNRTERMSLNAGGNSTEIIELESDGGFHSNLLVTSHGTVNPLQFLSTDGDRWVVSGTAFLKHAPRPGTEDSIAPAIQAVQADLLRSLTHLKLRAEI
ncbi:MAG: hypothetical protein K2L93_07440 [Muribaculaceae bacterium]|nr:hypothetical protein [Muribaculaceae bacterium]